MKEYYKKPLIIIDILEKDDVLLSSAAETPSEPATTSPSEVVVENRIAEFSEFFKTGSFFDYL